MSDRLRLITQQIELARNYTLMLLKDVDPKDWFTIPPAGVSHVAWQVGHLAMADYRLLMERVRGRREGDDDVFPPDYLRMFGKGSGAEPDPSLYPTPAELRATLDRVHHAAMAELAVTAEAVLDEPPAAQHKLFDTKFGALQYCALHEAVHAGQIGLLRRQLGAAPAW